MASVSGLEGPRRSFRRLGLALGLTLLGLSVSLTLRATAGLHAQQLASSPAYEKIITALLAVGLFASAFGISRPELRRNARVVVVAITFGVAVKAIVTGGIMALAYGSAGYLLLGVAVAQIDPLSVAMTLRHSGMSERAKSVLSAWASFDDPITILLVVYLASFVFPQGSGHGLGGIVATGAGPYLGQFILNSALVAVAAAAWYVLALLRRHERTHIVLLSLMLTGLIAWSVYFNLLIGITICGLFFRPAISAVLARVVGLAFYLATFLLGMLLVAGANWIAGILLGASAFSVQMLAGAIISHGMPRNDRVHLSLGQQNGLTAIVLALILQPSLPAAVGIIAISILVVNVLHIISNGIWDLKVNGAARSGDPLARPAQPGEIWREAELLPLGGGDRGQAPMSK